MHRFQLIRKNADIPKTYALMDGVYFGGNTGNDILCLPTASAISNKKCFSLTVEGDQVKLSSLNTTIYINGKAEDIPLENRTLKHGDLIGIGCPTTQQSITDPTCHVFEVMQREKPAPEQVPNRWGCCHPTTKNEVRKTVNRIDCIYSNCPFACWCVADLSEHLMMNEEHIAEFEMRDRNSL